MLEAAVFEQLRVQIGELAELCSARQLLDLADDLHDRLRRRRASGETASFAPADVAAPLYLD